MFKFDYALMDAQWILTRNHSVAMNNFDPYNPNYPKQLTWSTLSSIFKIASEFEIGKIILVFDTPPYHKLLFLDEYKQGRPYVTMEEAEEIKDPNERETQKRIAQGFIRRKEVKDILENLDKVALPALYHQGWEADDLVYLLSWKLHELGKTSVLISVDSDWQYWVSPSSSVYNPQADLIYTYEECKILNGLTSEDSLFEFKSLFDSFYASHNGLYRTIKEELVELDCHEVIKDYRKGELNLFDNYELFKKQLKSFDFKSYPEYSAVEKLVNASVTAGTVPSLGKVEELGLALGIDMNIKRFSHYLDNLNPNLFEG